MTLLEQTITDLKRHEGLRLKPYLDTVGKWTIGIGHNLSDDDGHNLSDKGITVQEAGMLLLNDLNAVLVPLSHLDIWANLDDVRKGVLLNMAFNMGFDGLMTFTATMKAIRENRFSDASQHMLESKWASQVGHRAVELAKRMQTGVID